MSEATLSEQLDPDLRGVRVGLSGAIPEPDEWQGRALDWEILNAVTTLADTVFSGGGYLVHGSHPSFTPRILAQAAPYAEERGEPVATFVLSGLFADSALARQLRDPRHEDVLNLILVDPVIPPGHEGHGAEDSVVRNASLAAMRERLVNEMDAMVIIGGKRWAGSANKPGTQEELELAQARGIPCYPLGGLGGMAAELGALPEFQESQRSRPLTAEPSSPQLTTGVRGLDSAGVGKPDVAALSPDEYAFVRSTQDYGRAIGVIAARLAHRHSG